MRKSCDFDEGFFWFSMSSRGTLCFLLYLFESEEGIGFWCEEDKVRWRSLAFWFALESRVVVLGVRT